ncbi:transcription factor-like 5 protein isoform X1 [Phasianus colchicus]|uniref:transcription factor-like 5 protein isoform X1 n=1 Tax=Phasianus colchicus TaxID=9054 RepID=UPI00129ED23C|nr:transcription factor-like 5 protein isoform X1 [Phasianus colchicus]
MAGPAPQHGADASFGEQSFGFSAAELSLVEMTDMEYGQLQHALYAHVEPRAAEGEAEAGPGAAVSPDEGCASCGPAGPPAFPGLGQAGATADGGGPGSNPCLGRADFQELRMMLLGEVNPPAGQADKTPKGGSEEGSGRGSLRAKHGESFAGVSKGSVVVEHVAMAAEPRSKSAVRVRLEDRFNSIQTENPRCQEPQESGVTLNNLVTLIRQPSELVGVPLHQHQNKCAAVVKNKSTPTTPSPQFTHPLFAMNACSAAGTANSSQAQASGTSCAILESAKHQEIGIPRTFSFCYHQEMESTKQTVGAMNKALPEEVWIKVGEDSLCKQAINKRSCSRISPMDANIDRKPLSEIQNMRDSQSTAAAQGPWQSAQSHSSVQVQSGTQEGVTQRRERHNRMERDRRRRIRICCDELNLLVPFCTADTDKATTLQWTTAFLKYIQEKHGDSLKQEFETVFCGKTGRRLKVPRSDSFVTCPVQENVQHGYGDQVALNCLSVDK